MAAVELQGVGKDYGDRAGVHDVSLSIGDGEFCVFVGPSGCGKSTLLRMIAGLEDITRGELRIDGRRVNELAPSQRDVAMVFQSYALYPHLDVGSNLGFALKLARTPAAQAQARIVEVARLLQIEHLLQRKPRELSGGQRQRVAIGRALVRRPGVFLFDEPLSNLDTALREQTRREIARLHRSQAGATSVYVTHDQVEAMTLADRMVLLRPPEPATRRSSVAQVGQPMALYHRPCSRFVAGFLGSPRMNFLNARVAALAEPMADVAVADLVLTDGTRWRLPVVPGALALGDSVTLGVRAEHLRRVVPEALPGLLPPLQSRVQSVEQLGDQTLVFGHGPAGELVLRLADETPVAVGEPLRLTAQANQVHLFAADGAAVRRYTQ
jgi:multiple sugar transport system ATP-binding protein